jgi:hypothetical protein
MSSRTRIWREGPLRGIAALSHVHDRDRFHPGGDHGIVESAAACEAEIDRSNACAAIEPCPSSSFPCLEFRIDSPPLRANAAIGVVEQLRAFEVDEPACQAFKALVTEPANNLQSAFP